jgi:phage baseplate assembly protein W
MALVGLSFPFRKEAGEFPKRDYNQEAIRSNIIALFKLPIRSRVMRPELGTTAYRLVFEPITPLLLARLQRSVRATIERGEPRASIQSVSITSRDTTVTCDIVYRVSGILDNVKVSLART